MNLGVIIVSYNVRDLLVACLRSVFAELDRAPEVVARVVVVDNASADGSAALVAADFPAVTLVASAENLGFARGNNRGLALLGFGGGAGAAPPDAVLLLNPDTEISPGSLATLTRFLSDHPRAGGCGPRLSYGDGSFQHSAFHFPGLAQLLLDFYPLHHRLRDARLNGRYARSLYEGAQPFAVDFVLGACLLVRSGAIWAVGLLDENYFMYAEEMDWQRRMREAGWPIYCVPAARVIHHEGQSARQFRAAMTIALWRSRLRYYDKYYPAGKRRLARLLVRQGMRTEMRRARTAHSRGQIDDTELADRLAAYAQVAELCQKQ